LVDPEADISDRQQRVDSGQTEKAPAVRAEANKLSGGGGVLFPLSAKSVEVAAPRETPARGLGRPLDALHPAALASYSVQNHRSPFDSSIFVLLYEGLPGTWLISLQELMELGGWKSFEMVLRYAHLAPEYLLQAASRIERTWEIVENNPTISLR